MAEGLVLKTVVLVGKAYVKEAEDKTECYLCIDSDQTIGIVFGFFAYRDIGNAQAAADALNLWSGQAQPLVIIN